MATITLDVGKTKEQGQKPRIYLAHAPGALEELRGAPLEEVKKGWKIVRWIKEFFFGRPITKTDALQDRLRQAKSLGIKPEDVENFWEGIEELRPPSPNKEEA